MTEGAESMKRFLLGSPMKDSGKYMTVWRKQADGSWKVVADMFNTNMPMQ
jgi:ketosteroid isomerase-like protein